MDHRRFVRSALLTFGSVGALAYANGAYAQTGPSTSEQSADVNQEIIVTAQKREESLQDVPISITALDGDELNRIGATQFEDYAAYVPGLNFASGGGPGQKQIILRGINTGDDPSVSVGVYVDDVPFGSSSTYARAGRLSLDLNPFDLERIEVLRGPQGTVYCASTLGGLLKYVTRSPSLTDASVTVQTELNNVAHGDWGYGFRGAGNAPLVSGKLALRVSGYYMKNAGFVDNVRLNRPDVNESRQQGFRGVLLWQPVPDVSVRLQALLQDIEQDGQGTVDVRTATRVPLGGRELTQFKGAEEPFDQKYRLYSGTVNWDLGPADLTSVTAYSTTDTFVVAQSRPFGALLDPTGAAGVVATFPLDLRLEKFTQEVRLASASNERFEWLVGGFYTKEDSANFQQILAFIPGVGPLPGLNPAAEVNLPTTYEEIAGFVNATVYLSPEFDITAGGRYSHNEQDFSQINRGPLLGVPPGAPPTITKNDSEDNVFTYQIGPRWRPTEDLTVYARLSKGYRPGGPNVVILNVPTPQTYKSDSTVNYEVGVKAALADQLINVDVSAFYIDWSDVQVVEVKNGVSFRGNGGSARSKGFEGAVTVAPADGLKLGVNFAYTDAELTEDALGVGGRAGDRLPYVARLSFSVVGDYQVEIAEGTDAFAGFTVRRVGKRQSTFSLNPNRFTLDDFTTLDLRAGINRGQYGLTVFAKNITDEVPEFSAGSAA